MAIRMSTSKRLLLLTALLSAGAAVLFGFLFFQIKSANERASELQNGIELQEKQESARKSVKAAVTETAALREKLNTFAVPKEGAAEFLELLESAARRIGVVPSILSASEEPMPDSDKYENLRVILTASGAWEGVVRFLGALESVPYEAAVEQALLSHTEKGNWRIDATIRVLTTL